MNQQTQNEPRLERQNDNQMTWARSLRHRLRLDRGSASTFGSEKSFDPPIGRHLKPGGEIGGYYIDFGFKTETPEWPPYWLAPPERQLHVATAQWGLGAYERFLDGDGEHGWRLPRERRTTCSSTSTGAASQAAAGVTSSRCRTPTGSTLLAVRDRPGRGRQPADAHLPRDGRGEIRGGRAPALKPMLVPVPEGGMLRRRREALRRGSTESTPPPTSSTERSLPLWGFHDVGAGTADTRRRLPSASYEALAANLLALRHGLLVGIDLLPAPGAERRSPAWTTCST